MPRRLRYRFIFSKLWSFIISALMHLIHRNLQDYILIIHAFTNVYNNNNHSEFYILGYYTLTLTFGNILGCTNSDNDYCSYLRLLLTHNILCTSRTYAYNVNRAGIFTNCQPSLVLVASYPLTAIPRLCRGLQLQSYYLTLQCITKFNLKCLQQIKRF